MKRASLRISAWVLALALCAAAVAFAQPAGPVASAAYGTTASPTFSPASLRSPLAPVAPTSAFMSWTNANYGTGGVSLRNRGAGNISISGVVGTVKAAFIYWAVIEPVPASSVILVQRLFPALSPAVPLLGTLIGTGPQPCWVGSTIFVYRAAIPLAVANGNGSYQVTLFPGAAGSTAGGDPWASPVVLPLWEGASIVMVGTGGGTVNLFDAGLSGSTFIPPFSYSLSLTGTTSGAVLWDNIGADGQVGSGRFANPSTSGETTTINGVFVSGPGSPNDETGDWNGSSGFPIPQLWDDTGHQFFPEATSTLSIAIGGSPATQADCLTLVANVVQF